MSAVSYHRGFWNTVLTGWVDSTAFWVLFFAGWIWHSIYQLTGFNDVIGLVAPVNESVWEHLKLGYGATLVLMIRDAWRDLRRHESSSILGRSLGIIAMNVFIVTGYYSYTLILQHIVDIGSMMVVVDIMLYGVASWIAVLLHDAVQKRTPSSTREYVGIAILIIITVVFAYFTIHVPDLAIFRSDI